jgi:hypothetical protein
MWHIVLTVGLTLVAIACPVLIAWGVIYADKVDERRWVASQRALEARRKAARLRALDAREAERSARLTQLDSDDEDVGL